ncbi:patatin-like phospholipase family protein [Terrabacter terrae]|uniref:Patatin-like phospholipase family protein n=1 Tax=Terrabacter terrae TaxID=318434 RepID=A0ABN2TR32_9MICO
MALVLGGGGILGASEVGMLRALLDAGVSPDIVVGTSVGAINGALVAAQPTRDAVERLTSLWTQATRAGVFTESWWRQAVRVARLGTHLHSSDSLRELLTEHLPDRPIEDLAVHFECVAARIETASARWFDRGPVVEAVLASCAVPGLLPAVRIDGEHYLDGGLVHSIPIARALTLGAREVYVLQVGRIEHPLEVPRRAWEVGLVSFEIARRHRFNEELASVPDGIDVHVLPTGVVGSPSLSLRYRGAAGVRERIERAFEATSEYLEKQAPGGGVVGRTGRDGSTP